MPTQTAQSTVPDSDVSETAPRTAPWHLWILLVWHPAVGLPVDPVAVLGLDDRHEAPVPRAVRWVPLVYDAADPWHERLGGSTTREDVEHWMTQSGACQVEAAEVPDGALDLAHAADIVLDELLAEVIPALPQRGDV